MTAKLISDPIITRKDGVLIADADRRTIALAEFLKLNSQRGTLWERLREPSYNVARAANPSANAWRAYQLRTVHTFQNKLKGITYASRFRAEGGRGQLVKSGIGYYGFGVIRGGVRIK